ncbi:hypothetical protein GCM10022198_25580 [Klugiella xanthotipulae]|uniref:Uncharacterized protein DUF1524 n=1 Tax=Klugiella xanthotipulae TaxID=244735 RepID=A0A543HYX8_9MICO|nr:HNH endonuclease family protein [Klugiella xanthotipulae]TQM63553.1 uncharacterized protein DUF1524 [Klugiella xanthotipulae]
MSTSKNAATRAARARTARRARLAGLVVAFVLVTLCTLQYLEREGIVAFPGADAHRPGNSEVESADSPVRSASSGQLTAASADILLASGLAHATDGGVRVDTRAALDALDGIPAPTGRSTGVAYDRAAQFGDGWVDTDHNGCDTRNDVLRRDLTDVRLVPNTHGCRVLSGSLYSMYRGERVTGEPGKVGDVIHIDHVVALSWAWKNGADAWSRDARIGFANDPIHLKAEEAGENTRKSDDGPAAWSPPNPEGVCEYAALFTNAVAEYRLSLPSDDRRALRSMFLSSCGETF